MIAKNYVKVFCDTLKPWLDQVAEVRPYAFQQDSAPVQKARVT